MKELSLHILDIAQNSVAAGASTVTISVTEDTECDLLTISIKDDGCGMSKELLSKVTDPFTTTRTTRKVGLGIPMMKAGAERAGGAFTIESLPDVGTTLWATYQLSHIDRAPMGDLAETVAALINGCPDKPEFLFSYQVDGRIFELSTIEMKQILSGVPLNTPDVYVWLRESLKEGIEELHGGA